MRRVIIAFDSFKGSLSAQEANEAFAEGIRDICPDVDAISVAISDGGEGISECVGGSMIECVATDPLGRVIMSRYALLDADTAVIASSAASGLMLLEESERDPLNASTYGTGELMLNALNRGCRRIIVGLGGSATCDCGVGMLRAMGYRFMDEEGRELLGSIDILEHCVVIDSDKAVRIDDVEFFAAVDVDNPLYGKRGSAYVFASQKGAPEDDVVRLDRALRRFSQVVAHNVGEDHAMECGVGAAGGLAFALRAMLGAQIISGIDLMLDIADFDNLIKGADLIVTGEGRVDCQTVMGKAPSGVLRRAMRAGVECLAVGGSVASCPELDNSGFAAIYSATPDVMTIEEAMRYDTARANLRAVGRRVAMRLRQSTEA